MIAHGQCATRLGLPAHDLSLDSVVADVVVQVKTVIDSGLRVLLWASLPCTPWGAWQSVNAGSKKTASQRARVERARVES